jgi:hypothetical protein
MKSRKEQTMEKFIQMRNQKLSEKVIKALGTRNMEGYYVNTKEEALAKALELIPQGSSVSWGGAMSAKGIGLMEELYSRGSYTIVDRDKASTPEEAREVVLKAFDVDFYIGGVNAMTEDGILVNVDGYSNRVAAYSYGPRNLLLVVSMKKVVKTLDGAIERARTVAAPINVQRFDRDTPCAKTGTCADCKSPDSICSNILITRFSHFPNRIKIILVNEDLGF